MKPVKHWSCLTFKLIDTFCTFTAPLKLSAPTSLMQNANTDATLVCHANKPYDDCLWTTPYGETYRFFMFNAIKFVYKDLEVLVSQ